MTEVRNLSGHNGGGKSSAVAEQATVAAAAEAREIVAQVGNGSAAFGDEPAAAPVNRRLFTLAITAALALLIAAIIASYLWREKATKVSAPGSSSIRKGKNRLKHIA